MDDQVTLPAYADQVRELIRHERNDEAIAICKHILIFHPKYIDAYRQIGEAYLEQGDLDNAKDLFRRVLSADPENVVAYTGLSMVFSSQQLINEAIWHLERAYELAPGNVELQKELLRLYNEVDIQPHNRLKLTSAALGRIYAQEGLFAHAIQEFRSMIIAVPSRLDVRVALAETLWHLGRLSEAAQVAQSILDQLPYCLKANLILGTAWKETGLPESELYLKRAQALDPMGVMATRLLGARSPISQAKPSVPRYIEGAPSVPAKSPATLPSELATFDQEIEQGLAGISGATEPLSDALQIPATETSATIPGFSDSFTQPATSLSEASPKPDVTPTVLPPWLQTKFPDTEPAESALIETPSAETPAEEMPSWLSRLQQAVGQTGEEEPSAIEEMPITQAPAVEPAQSTEALPLWLSDQAKTESTNPVEEALPAWMISAEPGESATPTIQPVKTESTQELPTWMSTPAQAAPSIEPVKAEPTQELPAWMSATPELAQSSAPAAEPAKAEPTQELPTWIQSEEKTTEHFDAGAEAESLREEPAPVVPTVTESAPPIAVEMPSAPTPRPAPRAKRQPKVYPQLQLAREYRTADRIDDALKQYDYLVQHAPRLIDQVIDDLEILLQKKWGVPLEAHRILGDAYTRADRLTDALEQYRFVLEHTPNQK